MKVLDLLCGQRHVFEGWFASEIDYLSQCERGLVTCPICNDSNITKKLSAPRLNLTAGRESSPPPAALPAPASLDLVEQAAWLALARHVVKHTDDVGAQFAEEARKIHYGEVKMRAIRGQASPSQTASLIEEGIAVVPLLLPEAFKGQLQ